MAIPKPMRLIVRLNGRSVHDRLIGQRPLQVGSSDGMDITLDPLRGIAGHHATLALIHDNQLRVTATHGSHLEVGQEETHEAVLRPGLSLQMGDYEVVAPPLEAHTDDIATRPGITESGDPIPVIRDVPMLRVMEGPDLGKVFSLIQFPATLGRAADNDVRLSCRSVSRHHALVKKEERGYAIHVVESDNGVRLGRTTSAAARLMNNSLFYLGDTLLQFELPEKEAMAAGEEATLPPDSEVPAPRILKTKPVSSPHSETSVETEFIPDEGEADTLPAVDPLAPPSDPRLDLSNQMSKTNPMAAPPTQPFPRQVPDQMEPAVKPLLVLCIVIIVAIAMVGLYLLAQQMQKASP